MENLQTIINLQELWLGRNRIRAINLCGLKCIKKISIQSNRLTSMRGLEVLAISNFKYGGKAFHNFQYIFFSCFLVVQECVALEELYLSHNGIEKMEGLSTLVNLRVLDVSANKLTAISDIANLTKYDNYFSHPTLRMFR